MSYTSYTITTYHCPNCYDVISPFSSFVPKSKIWRVYCEKCGTSVKLPSSFFKESWLFFLFIVLFIPFCFIGFFGEEPHSILRSLAYSTVINGIISKFIAWLIVDVFV